MYLCELLYNHLSMHAGMVPVISPSRIVHVCSGHQLELTCSVQGDFLRWNSDLFHEVTLQSFGPSDQRMVQQVNSVTVTTWRISASPLMSRLSINPVTNALNGSLISCVDLDFPDSPATTTISVVNERIAQGKYALIIMHGLIQALIMINLIQSPLRLK